MCPSLINDAPVGLNKQGAFGRVQQYARHKALEKLFVKLAVRTARRIPLL